MPVTFLFLCTDEKVYNKDVIKKIEYDTVKFLYYNA